MTRRSTAAVALAALAAAATIHAQQPPVMTARELLTQLVPRTSHSVLPLEGVLAPDRTVDHWRLLVNDKPVWDSPPDSGRLRNAVSQGLLLRPGNNVITLQALAPQRIGTAVYKWTAYVHREPPPERKQWAILWNGRASGGQIDSVREALVTGGVPNGNIATVGSRETLTSELRKLRGVIGGLDQVLIYYGGDARLTGRNNEPELIAARASSRSGLPVGSLIREAADLPGTSLLLDLAYLPGSDATGTQANQALAPTTAAPWLRAVSDGAVEVAFTNPAVSGVQGEFTADFASAIAALGRRSECATFAGVAQSVAALNSRSATAWPVFFSQSPDTSFKFCPANAVTPASLKPITTSDTASGLKFADVSMPGGAAAAELTVDGIVVPALAFDKGVAAGRVPIGPGLHVIATREARASNSPLFTGLAGTEVNRPVRHGWSYLLTAEIERRDLPAVTSEASIVVPFVIGNRSGKVRFELRNNGVVLLHEEVAVSDRMMRRQFSRRVPLVVGMNQLVVEVTDGEAFRSYRVPVERRRTQPVRAVVVGVDSPGFISPLLGAEVDANRTHDMLLRYTDATPSQVQLLTGSRATREEVLAQIARTANQQSFPEGRPGREGTFVLYFAGYGLSIENQDGSVTRCLLTAGFDPQRPVSTCLSTNDISTALDVTGRAVVIADTSYDGAAGSDSRTYRTYKTGDTSWRLTSGTDRPDRVFLVSSSANEPAMETSQGGLFTRALLDAIRRRLDSGPRPVDNALPDATQELNLTDAYLHAREATSTLSERRQTPVMKGVLSIPFVFAHVDAQDLQDEALGIARAGRNDVTAMRAMNATRMERGERLFEKLLSINTYDADARLGVARVRMVRNDHFGARRALNEATFLFTENSPQKSEWLSIQAELHMREGELEAAVDMAEQAVKTDPENPAPAALLGMLYATRGDYERSLATLRPLLSDRLRSDQRLTDEDLGRVVLHAYMAMRRTNRNGEAALLLKSYSDTFKGKGALLALMYQNPISRVFMPRRGVAIELGKIAVQAPWSHLVGQFFSGGEKYRPLLDSFLEDTLQSDPRDATAFQCLLHFYVGMRHALEGKAPAAADEFRLVADTKQIGYPEFWIARQELDKVK